ncbi:MULTISPECIES: hypothetical protein [unclassified Aminobacter]|uniref:hypothetical protein n=1 Tax=unclassified Aminobacter TaxID=2644704 RepID=UPI003756A7D1
MARKRRRKNGRSGMILGGAAMLALSAGLGGGLIYLYVKASNATKLDQASLCPTTGPIAVTSVLFDTTDPITKTTLIDLKTQFNAVAEAIPIGGLLEIYGLTAKPGELVKMFDGCNPGDGSSVDIWTQNPARRQKQWEDAFNEPLGKVESEIGKGQSGDQSPIMAGIQIIKLTVLDKFTNIPKKLIVASDMIEHTSLYSQYKSGIDYANYKSSPAYTEYATSLDGVEVTLWYVNRKAKSFNSAEHVTFWANWVEGNDGSWQKPLKLEGMN